VHLGSQSRQRRTIGEGEEQAIHQGGPFPVQPNALHLGERGWGGGEGGGGRGKGIILVSLVIVALLRLPWWSDVVP
jgi:hypothetical protein